VLLWAYFEVKSFCGECMIPGDDDDDDLLDGVSLLLSLLVLVFVSLYQPMNCPFSILVISCSCLTDLYFVPRWLMYIVFFKPA